MGSKVIKKAVQLGLDKLKLTTLYTRPSKVHYTFSGKHNPNTFLAILDYMKYQDPSFMQDSTGGGRNKTYYFLSQAKQIYMEIIEKVSGFDINNPANHATKVNIYCNKDETIREIAQIFNTLIEGGILTNIVWQKIEDQFKVKADDCLAEWKKWL